MKTILQEQRRSSVIVALITMVLGGGAGGVARPVCAADVHPAGGGPC